MKRIRQRRRRRDGFTLLEILLVLAILVILGGLVVVNFSGVQDNAYKDVAKTQINGFKKMLEMHRLDTGQYPTNATGLNALLTKPSDLPNPDKWKGPYTTEDIPADPWGRPYKYESSGPRNYKISSDGPNGIAGDADDITS